MSEFIFYSISFLYLLMLTWFRMSSRQIVLVLGYATLTSILYGNFYGFSKDIVLIICATALQIVITMGYYITSYKKDGVKFDQPIFEKGSLRVLLKFLRDVLSKDKK